MIKVNPIIFLFSVIGGIIVFIMAETWGAMPKNQVDDQLISEAIAEAIAIHEADPTSHMGEGESIDMHRTNEIIDHPANSVVPDKFSSFQPIYQTFFENIDTWQQNGDVSASFLHLSFLMRGDHVGDKYAFNESFEFLVNQTDDTPVDNMFQTQFNFYQQYHVADYYFGMGVYDSETPVGISASFKIVDRVLYTSFGNDVSLTYTSYGTLDNNKAYIVRVQTSKEFKEVYWIVNGVIIRTESIEDIESFYLVTFGVFANKVGGTLNSQYNHLSFKYLLVANEIT